MTEMYNFDVMINVKGRVKGYSKRDAYATLAQLARWSQETFEDSLQGRVDTGFFSIGAKEMIPVPKAPEPEQVILPDSRMWRP